MAATSVMAKEGCISGSERYKRFKITHDGSDTGVDIVPGDGYGSPVGSYTSFSLSSGTFTFLLVAGTSAEFSYITFYSS